MGDIIEFRGTKSKSLRSDEPLPVEGAQILFFLGVRYERYEAPEAIKSPRKRSSRNSTTPARRKPPRRTA